VRSKKPEQVWSLQFGVWSILLQKLANIQNLTLETPNYVDTGFCRLGKVDFSCRPAGNHSSGIPEQLAPG
jgi:hypothetical protein